MIDADPVAAAVRAVMLERTEWTGTASDLLGALAEAAGERIAKSKTWPDSPRALSGRLRRAATFLRKVGIELSFEREGRARTRIIRITSTATHTNQNDAGTRPSATSASFASEHKPGITNGSAQSSTRTVAGNVDERLGETEPCDRAKLLKPKETAAVDGADANGAPQSGPDERATGGWGGRL